jgi:steroid delta-isomerase-like uncharacterized protein
LRKEKTTVLEENKAIAHHYYHEAYNIGDVDLADRLLASDYVHHNPFPGMVPDREGTKHFLALVHDAFPDLEFTFEDMIAEGDTVAVRWTLRGTHLGEWRGIPASGNPIQITGMHFIRIEEGKIVEEWRNADTLLMAQQMGFSLGQH